MEMIKKHPWIRTVYLYLFSLVGLVLMVIGAIRLVDLGLKMTIFTHADRASNYYEAPPMPAARYAAPFSEKLELTQFVEEGEPLTDEERVALTRWMRDYKDWEERRSKIDYVRANREREASNALAFLVIGFPLYWYHWRTIKHEKKKEYDANA